MGMSRGGVPRWLLVSSVCVGGLWLVAWLAAEALVIREPLPRADALVVFAGSSTYVERTRFAARLFKEGRAPLILLTNDGLMSGWSASEERNPMFFERAADLLQRNGIPPERIKVIPGVVTNTREEAERLLQYVEANELNAVLVITTPYQTKRALWILRRTFRDSGVKVGVDAPNPGEQSPRSAVWWTSALGWKLVPGEYLKLIYYSWRYN